ncbi:MAG: hypothetical protein KZQ93_18600 [Candidatus Thiodiazotropha sp. (ex Monitilora ramsayi)]|nr:hypothetical protein [Candidatus Thiodiazotropha sp. (ex Monitilora ramsayi)]
MSFTFPWLAAGIGFVLTLVLMQSGALSSQESLSLPLLTLLFISEFGFLVTTAGGVVAVRTLLQSGRRWSNLFIAAACFSLAITFFIVGLHLWYGSATPQ